jgi:hypothetical protein
MKLTGKKAWPVIITSKKYHLPLLMPFGKIGVTGWKNCDKQVFF